MKQKIDNERMWGFLFNALKEWESPITRTDIDNALYDQGLRYNPETKEIERRVNICKKVVLDLRTEENKDYYQGKAEAYKETLDLLDTLEVKEADLNKELSYEDYESFFKEYPDLSDDWGFDEAWIFAQYFFKLGLKTQKGE